MNKRVPRTYPVAQLLEIHDGDSVRLFVDLGMDGTWKKAWIRLKDVRAEELHKPGGPEAKADCEAWFVEHAPDGYVQVTTFWTPGSYKEIREEMTFIRFAGVITALPPAPSAVELNEWLRAKGWIDRGE